VRVADLTVTTPGETSVLRFEPSATLLEAPVFNEVLAPVAQEARVLASYASDYYADKPAVTLFQKGQGRVIQFGSFFTPQNVTALLDALAVEDPLASWAEIPAEVQAVVRSNGAKRFCFLLNFTSKPQIATFKEPAFDLLGTRKLNGRTELPPYGVCFVRC
jgi:beta-galactosidase